MTATTEEKDAGLFSQQLTSKQHKRCVELFLTCVWIIADFPYFMTYLPHGDDLPFHLVRIAGLAQGMRDGQFPVRMQTTQIGGYGYPVSVMYGDVFLYPAALLTRLGLGVKKAYVLSVFVFNLLTILFVYFIAKHLFRSTAIALTATALLTLFPYRLEDLYQRAAVGEYTALFFFLLLLYGLFLTFTKEERFQRSRAWIWVAVGCAGIVLSHAISVALVFLPAFAMLIVGMVHNHSVRVWKQLGLACVSFAGLVAGFLIPFLSYYLHVPMAVSTLNPQYRVQTAHNTAAQPAELLALFRPLTGAARNDPNTDMPYAIGWISVGCLVIFCVALVLAKNINKEAHLFGITLGVSGLITLFLATKLFPWRQTRFGLWNSFIRTLSTIQFPWRFIGIGATLLLITGCIGLSVLNKNGNLRLLMRRAVVGLITLAFLEGGVAASTFIKNSVPSMPLPQMETGFNYAVYNGEYLSVTTAQHRDEFFKRLENKSQTPIPHRATVSGFTKKGTTLSFTLRGRAGSSVELPLLMYPNYVVETSSSVSGLTLGAGKVGIMTLRSSRPVSTQVTIRYQEPVSWRVGEVVSAVTVVLMCVVPSLLSRRRTKVGEHLTRTRRHDDE